MEQQEKEGSFYKNFFHIYIALVLQNIITISVNLADNIMLGSYSEASLSGVAAVNQIQFVYQQLLMALGEGVVIFCSQFWGKKEIAPMKKISSIAMHAALIIGLILFLTVSIFPVQVMHLFTPEEIIVSEGVRYLAIIRFTYLFFAITQILLATLRSVETVKIAFYMSIATFFINCGINYILIFGHFGAPELGTAGAAIGTLCARVVESVCIVIYIKVRDKKLKLKLSDYRNSDKDMRKAYLKLTVPMLFVQGLWGINTALQTAILGHMTATAIAANSVASNLFLLVKSTAVGAASTASVIIGKTIGLGDMDLVKLNAKRLQRLFLLIGVLSGVTLFFLRIPILQIYNLQPATREMANTFLIILSVVCVGVSYQMPTNNGIIRGGGNAMFVVKLDLISIWGIVIPLSLFMAFVVKASPVVVVCCLNSDQLFKCIPAYIKSHYGNWIRKLT